MNTILWGLQLFIGVTFLYSGLCKTFLPIAKLIAIGQTGVEGLPVIFVRFIGIAEILGAAGIIFPWWLGIYPVLTPLASMCFAFIMPFAAIIHYRRREPWSVSTNVFLFMLCALVAMVRFQQL